MESELLPCPFCGGKAELFFNRANELYYIECYEEYNHDGCCETSTTFFSKREDVIEIWNTRYENKEIDK